MTVESVYLNIMVNWTIIQGLYKETRLHMYVNHLITPPEGIIPSHYPFLKVCNGNVALKFLYPWPFTVNRVTVKLCDACNV